jgi:hypothetical protein
MTYLYKPLTHDVERELPAKKDRWTVGVGGQPRHGGVESRSPAQYMMATEL